MLAHPSINLVNFWAASNPTHSASSCPPRDPFQPPGHLSVFLRSAHLQVCSFILWFPNLLHCVFNCFLPRVGSVAVHRKEQGSLFPDNPSESLFFKEHNKLGWIKLTFSITIHQKSPSYYLCLPNYLKYPCLWDLWYIFSGVIYGRHHVINPKGHYLQITACALTLGYKHRRHPAIVPSSLIGVTAPQLNRTIRPQIYQSKPGLSHLFTFWALQSSCKPNDQSPDHRIIE